MQLLLRNNCSCLSCLFVCLYGLQYELISDVRDSVHSYLIIVWLKGTPVFIQCIVCIELTIATV